MKVVSHLALQGGHWKLPDRDREQIEQRLPGVQIAGAGLDVTTPEPLPPEHPLWDLPNAIVTPHISGYTPGYFPSVVAVFADNLGRFVASAPLRNGVDKRLGYGVEKSA